VTAKSRTGKIRAMVKPYCDSMRIVKRRCSLVKIEERMLSTRSLPQGALSGDTAAHVATLAALERNLRDSGLPAPDRLENATFSL
jgi:hypothetical protein